MRLQKMQLGEPDASGRRRPIPIEGAIETVEVDEVIVSVGVSPNPLIPRAFSGLEISKKGTIVVDEASRRSALPDVYAGGDIVRGCLCRRRYCPRRGDGYPCDGRREEGGLFYGRGDAG